MVNDELPDLDAIVREVGWIDHKAKRSAELAYEQARAHYEPIVAELREEVRIARESHAETMAAATARIAKLAGAMQTINAIRNSIIGAQTVNWSEHVYPLMSALDGAGYRGLGYEEARANVKTTLERIAELEALEQVCLSWGGSIQALAEDILNTTAVGKRMKEQLDG